MTNNQKLKQIMKQRRLTQPRVATLTGYSLDTVKSWCSRKSSDRYRIMPTRALRSLERELELFRLASVPSRTARRNALRK